MHFQTRVKRNTYKSSEKRGRAVPFHDLGREFQWKVQPLLPLLYTREYRVTRFAFRWPRHNNFLERSVSDCWACLMNPRNDPSSCSTILHSVDTTTEKYRNRSRSFSFLRFSRRIRLPRARKWESNTHPRSIRIVVCKRFRYRWYRPYHLLDNWTLNYMIRPDNLIVVI